MDGLCAEMAGGDEIIRIVKAAQSDIASFGVGIFEAQRRTALAAKGTLRNRRACIPIRLRKPLPLLLAHVDESRSHATGCPLAHPAMAKIGVAVLERERIAHPSALAPTRKCFCHCAGIQGNLRRATALHIISYAIIYLAMSEDLGFLIGDTARLMRRAFDERVRTQGITRAQWRVLGLLHRFGGCTQVNLAEMMDVEPITAGRMIDRLQEAGLVERRADPADRRAWRIHLTLNGESKLEELRPTALSLFEDAVSGLDDSQQAQLEAMLNVMRSNLTRKPAEVVHG